MALGPDPFAAMGGGVQVNGGWVPKDHPLAQQATPAPAVTPTQSVQAAPPPAAPQGADPFTAMGGGVWTGSGWVPKDHPAAQTVQSQTGTSASSTITTSGGSNSSPGTEPTFNSVLTDMLKQPIVPNANDPQFRAQSDAYRVAREQAGRRQMEAEAERFGSMGMERSSAFNEAGQDVQSQMGRDIAGYQGQLVASEMAARRQQLAQALQVGGAYLSEQQKLQVQQQLAQLDAQLRREGYGTQTTIAGMDNATRQRIADGQLNLGLLSTLIGNQNFNDNLALGWGNLEANANNQALLAILGAL